MKATILYNLLCATLWICYANIILCIDAKCSFYYFFYKV